MKEDAHRALRVAVGNLAAAHQNDRGSIPDREDELLAARIEYAIAKVMAEAKRPLPQAQRDRLCQYLAEVGR